MGYFSKANELYMRKDYYAAIVLYLKAIDEEENKSHSYYNLAVCYLKLKEYDNAISFFSQAIKLKANDSRYYFNLGFCYAMLKDNKSAIIYFNKAKKLDPLDKDTEKAIGLILKECPELASLIEDEKEQIKNTIEVKDCDNSIEELNNLKDEELNISVLVKQSKLIKQIDKALDDGDKDKFMKLSKRLKNMLNKAKKECLSGNVVNVNN